MNSQTYDDDEIYDPESFPHSESSSTKRKIYNETYSCSRETIFVIGLCMFIALLSFKPSEPYLSQYLICNYNTQQNECSGYSNTLGCSSNYPCQWLTNSNQCSVTPCSNITRTNCESVSTGYCVIDAKNNQCSNARCYKSFSENQVNNDIYPWSTYSYFVFLLLMGPMAEMFSYRYAILFGIMGRIATRVILLYGSTLQQMQIMQVFYAFGTAAEDLFSAYIYTVVSVDKYQQVTSYVKASALLASIFSGILGDILVTQFDTSLYILMAISTVFVSSGALLGIFLIQNPESITNSKGSLLSTDIRKYSYLKFHVVKNQLYFVCVVILTPPFSHIVMFWTVGNCVYSILYGYEVSIYSELHGGDEWNGSVLAVMLLAGCIGAIAPVYMDLDLNSASDSTSLNNNSLPTGTNRLEGVYKDHDLNIANSQQVTRKYWFCQLCYSYQHSKLTMTLLIAAWTSSACLVTFVLFWEFYISISSLIVFFGAFQFINVIFFAKLATFIHESRARHGCNGVIESEITTLESQYYTIVATASIDSNSEKLHNDAMDQTTTLNPILSQLTNLDVCNDSKTSDGSSTDNPSITPSSSCRSIGEDSLPPYSIAVIFVVGINVVLQSILQAVIFTYLQYSLYAASVISVFLFVLFTIIFSLCSLGKLSSACRREL